MTAILPTRRDEAWRYSDIDAVAAAWPLPAPESIIVPAGGRFARAIVQDAGDIRQIELVLGKGAAASLHILNIGGAYGRIELAVTLHEGADFHLGAAQIGGLSEGAHGCAIGELDAMALYYLQSRGLPPGEAKKLMLQAFVAGVFDGAEDEARLQELALAKLGELV